MTRLYYNKAFFRTLRSELKKLGFVACAPWKKNEVSSFGYRDVVVSVLGHDTLRISSRGSSETYPGINVGTAMRLIEEAKGKL